MTLEKKVSGIKLHIVVDTIDLPPCNPYYTGNVTDRKGAVQMIGLNINSLSEIKVFLVDAGHSGDETALW